MKFSIEFLIWVLQLICLGLLEHQIMQEYLTKQLIKFKLELLKFNRRVLR
jgi:hypothetical protein